MDGQIENPTEEQKTLLNELNLEMSAKIQDFQFNQMYEGMNFMALIKTAYEKRRAEIKELANKA